MKRLGILILIFLNFSLYAQQWYPMGNGFYSLYLGQPSMGGVTKIIDYQGEILAGGYFNKSGSQLIHSIGRWDGNSWQPFNFGCWSNNTFPFDSAGDAEPIIYKNLLYIAGVFDGAGGTFNDPAHNANNIAKWDGADWKPLTPLPSGVNSSILETHVYHNNLYIGGHFNSSFDTSGIHSSKGIAKWNDTVFSGLGTLAGNFPNWSYYAVIDFVNFNDKLVAGGFFTSIDGNPYNAIAAWNDTVWSTLGIGFNNPVFSLAVLDGQLYAGGDFTFTRDSITSVNHIAKWNGTNWSALDSGLNDIVYELCADTVNHLLYAGGKFTQTGGGQVVNHLAVWDGSNWSGVGGGADSTVFSLFIKDSNLYVGGGFTHVGSSLAANRIAVWGHSPLWVNELGITNEELGIYPNPNNGVFVISTEGEKIKEIKVFNLFGEKIYSATVNNIQTTINLSEQAKGIYFVQVVTDKGVLNRKIIVQ